MRLTPVEWQNILMGVGDSLQLSRFRPLITRETIVCVVMEMSTMHTACFDSEEPRGIQCTYSESSKTHTKSSSRPPPPRLDDTFQNGLSINGASLQVQLLRRVKRCSPAWVQSLLSRPCHIRQREFRI
jgi:hypothetical protein